MVNKYINYAPLEAEIFELIYISRSYSSTNKAQTTEYTQPLHTQVQISMVNNCTAFILIYSNTVGAVILSSVADVTTDFSSYNYTAIYQLLL